MASIGKLVSAIAEVEGLEEGAVKLIARYAREAGFISQGSFGPGAARMTPRDAANLLIAVNATSLAKDTAATIKTYSELRWTSLRMGDDERNDPFEKIFVNGVDFARALEELVLLATPIFKQRSTLEDFLTENPSELQIEFWRPFPRVNFSVSHTEYPENTEEKPYQHEIERGTFLLSGSKVVTTDRFERISISHRTLIAVGKTLAI